MVHDIFHDVSKTKEERFFWGVNIVTHIHGKVLKFLVSLNNDVHDSTYLVLQSMKLSLNM